MKVGTVEVVDGHAGLERLQCESFRSPSTNYGATGSSSSRNGGRSGKRPASSGMATL